MPTPIHYVRRASRGHLLHETVVIAATRAATLEETGRRRRATNHHCARIGGFDRVISRAQHLHIVRAADQTRRPFAVDIHLIPDFDCVRAATRQPAQEVGEVLIVT